MFLSLVARAATLGNSCNLHKSKMAVMDCGFATGWNIIQLISLKSCVEGLSPLYQIIFTRRIDFLGQFGDYTSINRSNVKFKVILIREWNTRVMYICS